MVSNLAPAKEQTKKKVENSTASTNASEAKQSAKSMDAGKAVSKGDDSEFEFAKVALVDESSENKREKESGNNEAPSAENSETAAAKPEKSIDSRIDTQNDKAAPRLVEMAKPELDGGIERMSAANESILKTHTDAAIQAAEAVQVNQEGKIRELSRNEKKKEDAPTKRQKTEAAVEEKKEDKVSETNAKLVNELSNASADAVDQAQAKGTALSKLSSLMPKTLEDVDNFKENQIATKVTTEVATDVNSKTSGIQSTFQKISEPEKTELPKDATPLTDIEEAAPTSKLSMGADILKPADEETLKLDAYKDESDNLLKKEGISDEHLSMVDSGELAEAKAEKEGIQTKVENGPQAVRDEEKKLQESSSQELDQQEESSRKQMRQDREKGLKSALDKQKDTKRGFEKEKETVTTNINKIYQDADKLVQDKLKNLKEKALAFFDTASQTAAQTFEKNVKSRIDIFKDARYARMGGSVLWLKDKLFGIDDFPEVKVILDTERTAYISALDGAIDAITTASQTTIDDCKSIIVNARTDIKKYIDGLGPKLKSIGESAQKDISAKLDNLDEKVNQAAVELKEALADKRKNAIEAIDKRIGAMRAEMSGALAKLGHLLTDALLKFFKWALSKFGVSMDDIMPVINKGTSVLTAIVTEPLTFMKNLADAVGGGISNFVGNFTQHFKTGFFEWLTGAMSEAAVTFPDRWDLKGILFFIGQLLGVGWNFVKEKLGIIIGKENLEKAENLIAKGEKGLEIATKIKEEGVGGAIEMAKEEMETIKETAITEITDWAVISIVKTAVPKILSMLNPVGAIIQIIMIIYKTVMWFINNFQRIVHWVSTVFDSIGAIASGAIGPAMQKVEEAMARTIPLIIAFLAEQLGLSGIAKTITGIIQKIRAKIDQIITKVVTWIGKKLKAIWSKVAGVFGGGKKGDKKGEKSDEGIGREVVWSEDSEAFTAADGSKHRLHYEGGDENAQLYIHSNKALFKDQLSEAKKADPSDANIKNIKEAWNFYNTKIQPLEDKLREIQKRGRGLRNPDAQTKNSDEDKVNKIHNTEFRKLNTFLAKINFEPGKQPTTVPTFVKNDLDSKGRAIKVTANPLTWIAGNTEGSKPSQDPKGWDYAKKGDRKGIYIRGHILNHNIHGPGLKWNLVPITRVMNSKMERVAESKGKEVLEENWRIMYYEGMVDEYYEKTEDAPNDDIYFPKQITITFGELKDKNGNPDPKGNKIKHSECPIVFSQSRPSMGLNINDLGKTNLVNKLELKPEFAEILTEERNKNGNFTSFENMLDRMAPRVSDKSVAAVLDGVERLKILIKKKIIIVGE